MDLRALRQRLDAERRGLARRGEVVEILPLLTRIRRDTLQEISFSQLTPTDADSAIAEQIQHYRRLEAAVEWKVYAHDTPVDLLQRLAAQGFTIGPAEAVLVLDLGDPPSWVFDEGAPVVRVRTERHVSMFRDAAEEIFGKDYGWTAGQLREGIAAGSNEHLGYVAVEGERAVSIGRLYTHPDSHFGGLYGGGTRASHRGRGFYRAVVAARARDAIELGACSLIIDALPTSQPILRRLGFAQLSETWPCTWKPEVRGSGS